MLTWLEGGLVALWSVGVLCRILAGSLESEKEPAVV
jgi:hypothetical protein